MSFKVFPLLALTAILFSRAKLLQQFGRWSRREYFSEIILKSGHWHSKSCRFKFIFSIFTFGGHFVYKCESVSLSLVDGYPRNISVKLF